MAGYFGPMFFEDVATEFIYFTLECYFKASLFKSKINPAYSSKQRGGSEMRNRNRTVLLSVSLQVSLKFSIII